MNLRHSAVGLLKTSQQTNFINTAVGLNNVGKGFFLSPILTEIYKRTRYACFCFSGIRFICIFCVLADATLEIPVSFQCSAITGNSRLQQMVIVKLFISVPPYPNLSNTFAAAHFKLDG